MTGKNMSYILSDTITTENGKPLIIIPSEYAYPDAEQRTHDKRFFRRFMDEVHERIFSVLTPDIDSLATCCYLEDTWNIPIGGYYDFEQLVVSSEILGSGRNHPFYVDCDVNGHEWGIGNHVRCVGENGMCFNLNHGIVADNYTQKCGASAYVTALYFNDKNFDDLTKRQKAFLIFADSFYLQYLNFRPKWDFWTDYIGCGCLTEILETTCPHEQIKTGIESAKNKYRFNAHINLRDSLLNTSMDITSINNDFDMDLRLPQHHFDKLIAIFRTSGKKHESELRNEDPTKIFSNTRHSTHTVKYSTIDHIENGLYKWDRFRNLIEIN